MVLVKWLALCAIGERKKERGGEEKKKRNAIAIIIPFDRRDIGEIIQSCYFVRERRIVASKTSIGGPKIPQMLENRVERRWKKGEVWEGMGKKKADENWPGIDRDRWHLTWHLTNCEISLLRTGIIADQRSIYFSLPQYSLAPPPTRTRSQLEIQFLPSLSPVVRPSPRRIKRRKDGRPRKECDRLSASIALIEK